MWDTSNSHKNLDSNTWIGGFSPKMQIALVVISPWHWNWEHLTQKMKAVLSLLSVSAFDVGSSNKRLDTKLKVQFLQFLHCSADILVILCVFFRCSKISSPVQKVRWTNGNNYVEWSRKLAGCIFPKRNFCECTFARCTQLSTPKGTLRVNLNQDICSTKGKPIFLVSEPINRTKLLETYYKDLLQHVPQKPGSSARSG